MRGTPADAAQPGDRLRSRRCGASQAARGRSRQPSSSSSIARRLELVRDRVGDQPGGADDDLLADHEVVLAQRRARRRQVDDRLDHAGQRRELDRALDLDDLAPGALSARGGAWRCAGTWSRRASPRAGAAPRAAGSGPALEASTIVQRPKPRSSSSYTSRPLSSGLCAACSSSTSLPVTPRSAAPASTYVGTSDGRIVITPMSSNSSLRSLERSSSVSTPSAREQIDGAAEQGARGERRSSGRWSRSCALPATTERSSASAPVPRSSPASARCRRSTHEREADGRQRCARSARAARHSARRRRSARRSRGHRPRRRRPCSSRCCGPARDRRSRARRPAASSKLVDAAQPVTASAAAAGASASSSGPPRRCGTSSSSSAAASAGRPRAASARARRSRAVTSALQQAGSRRSSGTPRLAISAGNSDASPRPMR